MKAAWATLAILAGLGILCCGGVFLFGWQAMRVTLHANHESALWANTHFPEIADHWDSAKWLGLSNPELTPDAVSIRKQSADYLSRYGELVTMTPFVVTSTHFVTSGKGLEFSVLLFSSAKFKKGPADVFIKLHHAMSQFTLEHLELSQPKAGVAP